ncbi:MAG: hypothetical protein WAX77_08925 [Methylococcaceae bacterium]
MPSITLKSHYDGQSILLDEPFDLPINSSLIVTISLPESEQWATFSMKNLAEAYSDNEPEYSLDDIRLVATE